MPRLVRAMAALAVLACSDSGAPSEVTSLRFVALAGGTEHSCGRTEAGTTYCWGDNVAGQIGARTDEDLSSVPLHVIVRPLELTSVSAGTLFSCGLLNTRVPLCWGSAESSPRPISGNDLFNDISAGDFVCGVRSDGQTLCWEDPDLSVYTIAGPLLTRVSVAGFACGLASDGTPWCWQKGSPVAEPVPGGFSFTAITVGSAHACGLRTDGMAFCWGRNTTGQLGNLSTTDAASPDTVFGGFQWRELTAGGNHTCGVTTTGAGYCWGAAGAGQLGYGGPPGSGGYFSSPVRIRNGELPPNAIWRTIGAGWAHTCGATVDGPTYCWGLNQRGQLGNGTTENSMGPVAIGPAR